MRRVPFIVNWPVLFIIVALVALTAGLVLQNLNLLPLTVQTWWPVTLLVPALVWLLIALLRRNPRQLLGSTTLLGLALGLTLITSNILSANTASVFGVAAIVIGAGLLLRGLLMNQQPI